MGYNINLIAYCGLYCPKCYKMKVAEAARNLLFELESAREKGAKFLESDPLLKNKITDLISLKCVRFCREGGGKSMGCEIKKCCCQRNVKGCWECGEMEVCGKLKPQFLENCKKIKEMGTDRFIEQYK